ncbi:Similar to Lipase 1; acc. no. P79066 [Pyronema omphalodes CBS 100304]|uniref:Carboxylic ester hydrolase n=1 Tax=Pyronema omphalodes (strain CBS 100304) TaxID=1076935 RepID=U4L2N5_PYROM|nr:Similar to Lipase 1; acc. no. P79066 [Pyronema omphalodes CBS 100304]
MVLLLSLLFSTAALAVDPLVTIKNGTLAGINGTKYNQDLFLGIPYAQPPLGNLRYRLPQSLNWRWKTPKDVKSYGPRCWERAGPLPGETDDVVHNEDCLTLSVIRPKDAKGLLSVVVWIHGGDLVNGGSSFPRYDMQNFVGVSQKYGQPVVAVSIQYRLGGFGFLGGSEVLKEKVANLGWHDQRLSLRWIQENIAAFGGNKDKVTIWGQSAGAQSVGAHLVGWGGDTEGLFRGAISQSGGPISYEGFRNITFLDDHYAQLLNSTNCTSLDCLRTVPAKTLSTYFRAYDRPYSLPMVDGLIYTELPSISVKNGRFPKIPYMIGTCSDEEALYTPLDINTGADVFNFLKNAGPSDSLSDATVNRVMELYPNSPPSNLPLTYAQRNRCRGAIQAGRYLCY